MEETPDQCIPSGVFTGTECYFRIVPASFLAQKPGYLVGDIQAGDGQEDVDTSSAFTFRLCHLFALAFFTIFAAAI